MKICYSLIEIEHVAEKIIKDSKSKTLLFYGEMGAGKTTLIKNIVKALGSNDEASSPTFSIVNEYKTKNDKIYHFDLYRVNDLEEAYNFGIEDYLESDYWKLIEWPEKIEPILDASHNKIKLELDAENHRVLTLE
ncbi:tRNA (adenosine(37)-N6)-threonylcarbamoyltransferase complex ATPase subunit type 1 TsaE [Flavobacteriaceae bacterium GSB9]|nr:tRNA (adenosine(37)-N6)-threonylcarbamoyltransferase complex ATPase subunit type 1 TsaE [Flavobacteriaceae bacterium GSB9]